MSLHLFYMIILCNPNKYLSSNFLKSWSIYFRTFGKSWGKCLFGWGLSFDTGICWDNLFTIRSYWRIEIYSVLPVYSELIKDKDFIFSMFRIILILSLTCCYIQYDTFFSNLLNIVYYYKSILRGVYQQALMVRESAAYAVRSVVWR